MKKILSFFLTAWMILSMACSAFAEERPVLTIGDVTDRTSKRVNGENRLELWKYLAVEELAYNIFEHGFDDGKQHFVDLKLLHKENMTKIRLRDDCRMFNPQEKVAVLSPEDKKKGIGLRMIFSVSADPKEMNVSYVNVLNLNNLIITVPDM